MGKRKQPFGYKMKLGEIVPQPQEAEAQCFIVHDHDFLDHIAE